jgi:Barstar (barnase inhibitor)
VRSLLALDLSDRVIETWDELCDALHEPCGLPSWFGRNLDAWWDTIHMGNISDVLDRHFLRVTVRGAGLFAVDAAGQRFMETTNDSDFASPEVVSA